MPCNTALNALLWLKIIEKGEISIEYSIIRTQKNRNVFSTNRNIILKVIMR